MQNDKKINKIMLGIFLFVLWGGLVSCGEKKSISLEETLETGQEMQETEKTDIATEPTKENGTEEKESDAVEKNDEEAQQDGLSVYVCGAVNAPGVYVLPPGSRLYQAVDAAGGMREDADKNYLNLAMELSDGEKIQVPTEEEVQRGEAAVGAVQGLSEGGSSKESAASSSSAGLVNINTADETLLMTLTGIGEAKAKSIVAYRSEQGPFAKIEDIMKIPGIKQSVFDKIKDRICVN